MAASMSAMAQENITDITPAAYDWANQEVGTHMVVKHYSETWNTPFEFSWQLGGSEWLENGGCISANACADPAYIEAGTEVVDLGGKIGKVMAINGASSKAKDVLGFTTSASLADKMQINIFTNPDNTPRGNWIRCKILLNIFSNTISTDDGIINNMYFMDADNNNLGSWFELNKINSANFVQYDEEGDPILDDEENYVYDKDRWMVFQVDAWNQDEFIGDGKEGTTSVDMPMKWKMWIPATGITQATIFIKSLKFYSLDGYNDKDVAPEFASGPNISFLTSDEVAAAVQDIKAAENTQKGIYTMAGQRVSNTQRGIYIVNGKKVVK